MHLVRAEGIRGRVWQPGRVQVGAARLCVRSLACSRMCWQALRRGERTVQAARDGMVVGWLGQGRRAVSWR